MCREVGDPVVLCSKGGTGGCGILLSSKYVELPDVSLFHDVKVFCVICVLSFHIVIKYVSGNVV